MQDEHRLPLSYAIIMELYAIDFTIQCVLLHFLFLFEAAEFFHITFLVVLSGTGKRHCAGGHIMGNRGACCSVSPIAYRYRCYKVRLAAKEYVIPHCSAVLGITIIVYEYASAAHVYAASNICISNIGKMREFGPLPHIGTGSKSFGPLRQAWMFPLPSAHALPRQVRAWRLPIPPTNPPAHTVGQPASKVPPHSSICRMHASLPYLHPHR